MFKGKKSTCPWCGSLFVRKSKMKYCSKECREDARTKNREKISWAKRLSDGSRLLDDDFGQRAGDDLVTFQDEEETNGF